MLSSTMGFSLVPLNSRDLWRDWGLRSLVLLSLFMQLILATQGSRRKSNYKYWIQVVVWAMYFLADSIAAVALGVLSNRLTNIKELMGTVDPKSQITAFWAPFLLLYLGGPDTITAYALQDNELWSRHLARLCVHVGVACYVYFMALSGSTLSILAAGMILMGFIKYAERTLCLYLASENQLRRSMFSLPDEPIYPRIMEQYTLKKEEGYRVHIDEVTEVPAPKDISMNSGQASGEEKATNLVRAYELFKIFKLLFVGLILNSGDLEDSKRMFMNDDSMSSETAFEIVEIELGLMYDLLYSKAPLLNRAWGIIRWVINLSVPCAVLVIFCLKDRKDYSKVDVCIAFLLICATILLEIYSILQAISSDWVDHWLHQRPRRPIISNPVASLRFIRSPRWSNSVAQFSLLGFSISKRNWIFRKYPKLAKMDKKLKKGFHIHYKELKMEVKEWIFPHMKDTVKELKQKNRLKTGLVNFMLETSEMLKKSNYDQLSWSVKDLEFDRSLLIWHIATELCHYKDRGVREDVMYFKKSKLISRYMLYLLVFHPSMLPAERTLLRYEDTSADARKCFEDKLAELSNKETGTISSVVKKWAQKLFKKEAHVPTCTQKCKKPHKSTGSRHLCGACHLLLQVESRQAVKKKSLGKGKSMFFDACYLASQLNSIDSSKKWDLIGKVWAKFLMHAALHSKGQKHSESLGRGGELLSHVWLLMAHLGMAELTATSEARCIEKLTLS